MKTIHMTFGSIGVAVLACIPATANSQAVSQSAQAAQSGPCFVSERGPHHRTWSKIITFEDASGNGDSQTNTAYVELATGMHYKGPGNEWLESSEEIELLPNGAGAKADRGQHKAFFPPDIHSGVVELCTPDGKWLKSQVLGLGYFDTATGKSVLITELKSSIGELHPPNAVIYPDSFSDGVQADIRYTYTLNGFEQDIILKSKLPSFPEDYSMNPGTTKLQVFTEFFDSPQPAIEQATLQTFDGRTFSDQTVGFGSFYIGQGKAFSTERPQQEIPVRKEWLNFEGRQFLIEEAPLPELQRELDVLPAPEQASLQSQAGDSLRVASLKRLLPVSKAGRKAQGEMRLSVLSTRPKGLVLDYVGMTSGQHNYVFRGDTTYYLSASVSCYGTTTFEGGSVLKYATAGRLNMTPGPPPYYTAAIDWKGAPYRPVILTSKDDDSVGEVIQGSSGDPTLQAYGNPMLYMAGFSPAPTIACARFAWANQAIYLAGVSTSTFSHVQFVNCQEGIGFGGSGATLRNCLLANVGTCFNTSGGLSASAESCTFSGNDYLGAAPSYPTSSGITFVNCVLANVAAHTSGNITLAGHHNGFYETPTLGSPPYYQTQTSPFVEAGAGDYYLSDGSGFRNVGTILLYAPLLDELRKKTTRPPLPLTGPITVNTALPRREIRDPGCDLGYHYDPLDWLIESISLQNATLTIRDGAAIGITCGTSQDGIVLKQGGKLDATGSFRSPNHIVRYTAVQEQASAGTIGIGGLIGTDLSSFSGEIHLQSTVLAGQHSLVSAHGITEASFRDCEFYGGSLTVGADGPETALWATSNCLLHRIRSFATPLDCLEAFFYNNLFFEGSVETDIPWATTFHFRDNFFYRTMLGDYGCTPLLDRDYNAYITGYGWSEGFGDWVPTLDDVVLQSFTFVSGPLGPYYYDSSDLLDKGSQPAVDADLFYHTTQISLAREGTSRVDIGFHYAADHDEDGLDDVWEMQYGLSPDIADDLHGPDADLDGDGLTNLQEYQQGTNPVRPNTGINDGIYKRLTRSSTTDGKAYDIYFRPTTSSQWRRISGVLPGQRTVRFVNPNPAAEGDYILLDAADDDGDGLSNGYENWFTYTVAGGVQRTNPNVEDSDDDTMKDGWEVQYGLNPKSTTPPDGGADDPEPDGLVNTAEYTQYGYATKLFNASYDPFRDISTEPSRPLITLSQSQASAFNRATFTITRHAKDGDPTPYPGNLTVYYSVGGGLTYGADFTLDPPPMAAHYPGGFAVEIPDGQGSVTVTVAVTPGAIQRTGNLTVALTRYSSAQ